MRFLRFRRESHVETETGARGQGVKSIGVKSIHAKIVDKKAADASPIHDRPEVALDGTASTHAARRRSYWSAAVRAIR